MLCNDPYFDMPDIDIPEPEDDTQPDLPADCPTKQWKASDEYWLRIAKRLKAMEAQLPLSLQVTRVRQYPPARDFDLRTVWENL